MLEIYILSLIIGICSGSSLQEIYIKTDVYGEYAYKIGKYLQESNISQSCKEQFAEYGNSLLTKQMWALKMFDAGGKFPSGIFEGNFVELGSFDECLSIEQSKNGTDTIFGKYCLSDIPLNVNKVASLQKLEESTVTMNLRIALCVPNACSANDVQTFYRNIIENITVNEALCQTKMSQPELNSGSIAVISVFGIILCIMVVSTAYDISLFYLKKEKPLHPLLTVFSVLTNGRKLLATTNNSKQLSCLYGIRVISTMWVIIGHRYIIQIAYPVKNQSYLVEWLNNQENMFLVQAPLSVDTFFLISGLVISYVYMTSMSKGVKFNILLYYIHRYLRLTPLLAVVVVVYITLLKHLGSGPLWPSSTKANTESCEASWWRVLFYVHNYGNINMCIGHAWYLSADMQLFLLSPCLLIPLSRWPKPAMVITGFLTVCCIVTCFLTAWYLELNGIIVGNKPAFFKYYYTAIHTRAAPWLIGILMGYVVFQAKHKKRVTLNKVLVILLWLTCLIILATCVFAGHDLLVKEYDKLMNSIHIAFVRPTWAVAVGWVVYACSTGYGGPINWFLSLPVFQVISKLTYSLYLVHFPILHITTAQMRTVPVISNAYVMYIFWGDFAYVLIISVVCTLAFESPIIVLEKMLFNSHTSKRLAVTVPNMPKKSSEGV